MRVKISTNPPLPRVRAWFPLSVQGHATVSSLKSLLCDALPAFCGVSPSSLQLSIDGFELLDTCELTIVRDGDLISVDARDVPPEDAIVRRLGQAVGASARLEPAVSHKRKRSMSTPSSSSGESDTESTTSSSTPVSESDSEASDSESTSDSDGPLDALQAHVRELAQATPSVQATPRILPSTFVPPGYGKPQTRSRNLRRRLRRMHERDGVDVSGGPVSGANAVAPAEMQGITPDASRDVHAVPALLSLSLRNKNKAKNFKSLMGRPLAPKIIFGDQEGDSTTRSTPLAPALPRLIPPSSRPSLPPNLFVTSVDVEAGLHRERTKRKMRVEYGEVQSEGGEVSHPEPGSEADIERLEAMANEHWATLALPAREQLVEGMVVGYKALGIDPVTCTPGQVLTVGRVESCEGERVVVRPLRRPGVFGLLGEVEEHTWDEIVAGDWRRLD